MAGSAAGVVDEVAMMRAFPVCMPSGARYWTVLDDELAVVSEADAFLGICDLGATRPNRRPFVCGRDRAVPALVRDDRPALA